MSTTAVRKEHSNKQGALEAALMAKTKPDVLIQVMGEDYRVGLDVQEVYWANTCEE